MALEVVFTKRADKKLDSILDYLRKEWSLKVAEEFIDNLYNIVDILARFPEIGVRVSEKKDLRSFLVSKHNRLYYRSTKKQLIILNFISTKQKSKK